MGTRNFAREMMRDVSISRIIPFQIMVAISKVDVFFMKDCSPLEWGLQSVSVVFDLILTSCLLHEVVDTLCNGNILQPVVYLCSIQILLSHNDSLLSTWWEMSHHDSEGGMELGISIGLLYGASCYLPGTDRALGLLCTSCHRLL
jgi:hypothetical protein